MDVSSPTPGRLRELHADLRPYPRGGFERLARLAALGLGGVLADDMGLGKIVQTRALICHRLQTALEQPFLSSRPRAWSHVGG